MCQQSQNRSRNHTSSKRAWSAGHRLGLSLVSTASALEIGLLGNVTVVDMGEMTGKMKGNTK